MSEQKQEQPTIEGIEYSIIKSVGNVVNFAKQADSQIKQMEQIINLQESIIRAFEKSELDNDEFRELVKSTLENYNAKLNKK